MQPKIHGDFSYRPLHDNKLRFSFGPSHFERVNTVFKSTKVKKPQLIKIPQTKSEHNYPKNVLADP